MSIARSIRRPGGTGYLVAVVLAATQCDTPTTPSAAAPADAMPPARTSTV